MATRMLLPTFMIFAAAGGPQMLAQIPADTPQADEKRRPTRGATSPKGKPCIGMPTTALAG